MSEAHSVTDFASDVSSLSCTGNYGGTCKR